MNCATSHPLQMTNDGFASFRSPDPEESACYVALRKGVTTALIARLQRDVRLGGAFDARCELASPDGLPTRAFFSAMNSLGLSHRHVVYDHVRRLLSGLHPADADRIVQDVVNDRELSLCDDAFSRMSVK